MNPNLCTVVLRPRSAFEVFDLTLLYLRRHASSFGRLFGVVVLPLWLASAVLAWLVDGHPLVLLLPLLAVPFLKGPFVVLGGHLLFSRDLGVKGALTALFDVRYWGALFATGAIGGLISVFTLATGLAFWMPMTAFVPESVLLERVSVGRSLTRARALATGHFGHAAITSLSSVWLTVWGGAVAELGGQLIVSQGLQLGTPFGSATDFQVTPFLLFGLMAAQPLHALYRLLLYIDVRTRVEGWDLQVAFRSAAIERDR